MQRNRSGYYSSDEKDIIREHFDLPLLRTLHERKDGGLTYFGLPGAEARDIKAWQEIIKEVVAVDRNSNYLDDLEQVILAQLPNIAYSTHLGELDEIILRNMGDERLIDGESHRPEVGNVYKIDIAEYVWQFDVVYLDYFGTFLPRARRGEDALERAINRGNALRRLFDRDRVDGWQSWVMLLTVEARASGAIQTSLQQYLEGARRNASNLTTGVLDFLLECAPSAAEGAARLIHGATGILLSTEASHANLRVRQRGTVLYRGSNNTPMVHMAFEFDPLSEPLGQAPDPFPLLSSPILRPMDILSSPWFESLPQQSPETTEAHARNILNFLDAEVIENVVGPLN